MSEAFDAERYTITIRKEDTEDGLLYVGKVAELPDICVFEQTHAEAYAALIDVVQTTQKLLAEDGTPMPAPNRSTDRQFSGRLNLRVPATMHAQLVSQAATNEVSLNQWCNYLLATQTAARTWYASTWQGLGSNEFTSAKTDYTFHESFRGRITSHAVVPSGSEVVPIFKWQQEHARG